MLRFVFFGFGVLATAFAIDVIILLHVSQGLKKSEAHRAAREVTPHEATKGTGEPSHVVKARAPKEPAGLVSTHSPPEVNP